MLLMMRCTVANALACNAGVTGSRPTFGGIPEIVSQIDTVSCIEGH